MITVTNWAWAFRAVVWCSLSWAYGVQAQNLRDPTVAPNPALAAPGAPAPSPLGAEGTSVIVRDGKAGLVQGTRIVFPGQKWGRWTLERITETEVWLRDGGTLRKQARFSGIERSVSAVSTAGESACAARSPASAPAHRHKNTKTRPTSTTADTPCDAPLTRYSNP